MWFYNDWNLDAADFTRYMEILSFLSGKELCWDRVIFVWVCSTY